jgi:hypothetical protein
MRVYSVSLPSIYVMPKLVLPSSLLLIYQEVSVCQTRFVEYSFDIQVFSVLRVDISQGHKGFIDFIHG